MHGRQAAGTGPGYDADGIRRAVESLVRGYLLRVAARNTPLVVLVTAVALITTLVSPVRVPGGATEAARDSGVGPTTAPAGTGRTVTTTNPPSTLIGLTGTPADAATTRASTFPAADATDRPGQFTSSVAASATGVFAKLSSHVAVAASRYDVTFTPGPGGALQSGQTITLTAPRGTEFQSATNGWSVTGADGTTIPVVNVAVQPDGPDYTANQAVLTLAGPVAAKAAVTVTALWVTNAGPSRAATVTVATSAEPAPAHSQAFALTGPGRVSWATYAAPPTLPVRCWGSAASTADCRTHSYMIFDPHPGVTTKRPLLVDLHGCVSTAATEARWSRFDAVAGARGFVVLYPQQSAAANGGQCWNWFDPADYHRGAGEPAIIADLTKRVMSQYNIDPRRVYISGESAGAGMSSIMAVTYPDLYASAAVYAGCQYQGLPCFGAPAAQPPTVAAQLAIDEMGARARSVPVFSVQGDADELVPMADSEELIQQWVAMGAYRRTGTVGVVPALPTSSRTEQQTGKQPATVDRWRDDRGCLLAQRWLVQGMAHQWADTPADGSPRDTAVTDPSGPDVTTALVAFFLAHPMPTKRDVCGR